MMLPRTIRAWGAGVYRRHPEGINIQSGGWQEHPEQTERDDRSVYYVRDDMARAEVLREVGDFVTEWLDNLEVLDPVNRELLVSDILALIDKEPSND